jgi:type VI protein secretion system component VasF
VNESSTDDRLRDALQALASGVPQAPDDYRAASSGWRRRERRRRLILALLVALVLLLADIVGLWALNQTDPNSHVIFSDPRPTSVAPRPQPTPQPLVQLGQP